MQPTIGQTVMYKPTERDTKPSPAIIMDVHDDGTVDLNIFRPGLIEFARNKSMAPSFKEAKGDQWSLSDI